MAAKVKGLDKAIKHMEARAKAFKSGKPYTETSKIMAASINKNVNTGGRPKWKKRKYDYAHPILDKSGYMRDKAEVSTRDWRHGRVYHVNKILGPTYGLIHQYTGVPTRTGSSLKNIVRKYIVFQKSEINGMQSAFRKAFLQK